MFNNVGKKIESLAKIFLYVSIGLFILAWLILLILGLSNSSVLLIVVGVVVLVLGTFISWIESVLLFGFGRLIKNSDILVDNSDMLVDNTTPESSANPEDFSFQNQKSKVCPGVVQKRSDRLEQQATLEQSPKSMLTKIITEIVVAVIGVISIIAIVVTLLTSPQLKYNRAMDLIEREKYEKAVEILADLDYKDSNSQVETTLRKMLQVGEYKKAADLAQKLKLSDMRYYKKVANGDYAVLCSYFQLSEIELKNGEILSNFEFCNCYTLKTVIISGETKVIPQSAFADCTNLTTVVISDSVTYIGENAFSGCNNLLDVYFMGTKQQWNEIVNSNIGFPPTAVVHYGRRDIIK